jgi:putative hydrolase of the HAD superfamily
MVKPEVAIFQLMADKLGLKPQECVMIDDKPINVEGAKNAGMHAIMFINQDQALDELQNLLGQN